MGLPSSAGIAAVKFAAKIASDLAKPNGQKEVPAAETRAFLASLPVARLWGVGRPFVDALANAFGVYPPHLYASDCTAPSGADPWRGFTGGFRTTG